MEESGKIVRFSNAGPAACGGVHFYNKSNDSSTKGEVWVYRYDRASAEK